MRFSDDDYRHLATLYSAIRRVERLGELHSRAVGIPPQQYVLLLLVRGHEHYPDVSIGQVAEYLQVRHHSASMLVDRAVRHGLIARRVDDDDRRRVFVSLTERGQDVLERILDLVQRDMGMPEEAMLLVALRDGRNTSRREGP